MESQQAQMVAEEHLASALIGISLIMAAVVMRRFRPLRRNPFKSLPPWQPDDPHESASFSPSFPQLSIAPVSRILTVGAPLPLLGTQALILPAAGSSNHPARRRTRRIESTTLSWLWRATDGGSRAIGSTERDESGAA